MQLVARTALVLALIGVCGTTAAGTSISIGDDGCDIDSPYSLDFGGDGIAFKSDKSSPQHVRLDKGRLYIDGREMVLSPRDRRTIDDFENEVRDISAEAVVIASEGIDIAFDALSEVSRAFVEDSGRQASLVRSMEKTRGVIQNQIRDAVLHRPFDETAFEALIESQIEKLASELVQIVVAEFVPRAINAALSGNEAAVADIERRAAKLEADIERRIESKAGEIERRAEKLCPRVEALAAMQSRLEMRLENGDRLNLIED
jgi:hypothetical protein